MTLQLRWDKQKEADMQMTSFPASSIGGSSKTSVLTVTFIREKSDFSSAARPLFSLDEAVMSHHWISLVFSLQLYHWTLLARPWNIWFKLSHYGTVFFFFNPLEGLLDVQRMKSVVWNTHRKLHWEGGWTNPLTTAGWGSWKQLKVSYWRSSQPVVKPTGSVVLNWTSCCCCQWRKVWAKTARDWHLMWIYRTIYGIIHWYATSDLMGKECELVRFIVFPWGLMIKLGRPLTLRCKQLMLAHRWR